SLCQNSRSTTPIDQLSQPFRKVDSTESKEHITGDETPTSEKMDEGHPSSGEDMEISDDEMNTSPITSEECAKSIVVNSAVTSSGVMTSVISILPPGYPPLPPTTPSSSPTAWIPHATTSPPTSSTNSSFSYSTPSTITRSTRSTPTTYVAPS
ncbi:unnamed protein product, partial [Staurois parvus]